MQFQGHDLDCYEAEHPPREDEPDVIPYDEDKDF